MDSFKINGGKKLSGEITVSGSKNAALPLMCASILTNDEVILHHMPDLMDIRVLIEILEYVGKKITFKNGTMIIKQGKKINTKAPYDLVKKMRASIIVLGPLLAKYKECKVSLPGGCAFGPRPVDLHIMGMEKLGAKIEINHGYIDAKAEKLVGDNIYLAGQHGPSVLGTDNIMMAAVLAEGETVIDSAAMEPECSDLANMLVEMGADISGIGTTTLRINGVKKLHGVEYSVIPDRIEAGTFLVLGVLLGEEIKIKNCEPKHLSHPIDILRDIGADIEVEGNEITVRGGKKMKPFVIDTKPYPLFPTDLQPIFTVLACFLNGASSISEGIWPDRFQYTQELVRMGANIKIEGSSAIIMGIDKLTGAQVMAPDLRAGAALVLAGLMAEDETQVHRIYHIDRGYEGLENKLVKLGADIKRV